MNKYIHATHIGWMLAIRTVGTVYVKCRHIEHDLKKNKLMQSKKIKVHISKKIFFALCCTNEV